MEKETEGSEANKCLFKEKKEKIHVEKAKAQALVGGGRRGERDRKSKKEQERKREHVPWSWFKSLVRWQVVSITSVGAVLPGFLWPIILLEWP